MPTLSETIKVLAYLAGVAVFLCICVWSAMTLKANTGGVFNRSMIAGIFVLFIVYGKESLLPCVIGLAALGVIVFDTMAVYKKYGGQTALARALSAVYGALIFVMIAYYM